MGKSSSSAEVLLLAVLVGRAVRFGPRGQQSAIAKHSLPEEILITASGLVGDEQGDTKRHGGLEKAVHAYPHEHYRAWNAELGDRRTPWAPGGFGENLSLVGLQESHVCIGDVWSVGSALLQVSQGRQPCWKLNLRFSHRTMARAVQSSGRTGWYFRVLQEGLVRAGKQLSLVARPQPSLSLARVHRTLYVETLDRVALEALANAAELTDSWRALATRRLSSGRVESWAERLGDGDCS